MLHSRESWGLIRDTSTDDCPKRKPSCFSTDLCQGSAKRNFPAVAPKCQNSLSWIYSSTWLYLRAKLICHLWSCLCIWSTHQGCGTGKAKPNEQHFSNPVSLPRGLFKNDALGWLPPSLGEQLKIVFGVPHLCCSVSVLVPSLPCAGQETQRLVSSAKCSWFLTRLGWSWQLPPVLEWSTLPAEELMYSMNQW